MVQDGEVNVAEEYFEWMYHLVCNEQQYNKLSYRKLLYFLDSVEFVPMCQLDENRRIDGLDFRYRFGYEHGYSDEYIDRYLSIGDCSVLEMMIALAFRVEENIMSDDDYGNRTGQWFWNMIVSLGLGSMSDDKFDRYYCERVIDRFLNKMYEPDGKGGLFTVHNAESDLRDVDIWCQFMWYLNENKEEV